MQEAFFNFLCLSFLIQCGTNKDTDPLEMVELIVMKCVKCVENHLVSDVNTSKQVRQWSLPLLISQ